MSDVCTYKLLKRLIPDKPGIEVSTCTRSIDQCMKPAVKMLRQKFRCKQRIIRSQETEKLPPLLFPALVVDFFSCSSRSAQYEGSLQLSSNRSIAPSCLASRVQPPLVFVFSSLRGDFILGTGTCSYVIIESISSIYMSALISSKRNVPLISPNKSRW